MSKKFFARLFLLFAWLALFAAAAPIAVNFLFAQSERANRLLGDWLQTHTPNFKLDYADARLRVSYSGLYVRAANITATQNGVTLATAQTADFWLKRGQLQAALYFPKANITPLLALTQGAGAGKEGGISLRLRGQRAELVLEDPPATLSAVNFLFAKDQNGWRARGGGASEGARVSLAAGQTAAGWAARLRWAGAPPAFAGAAWQQATLTAAAAGGRVFTVVAFGSIRPHGLPPVSISVLGRASAKGWSVFAGEARLAKHGALARFAGKGDTAGNASLRFAAAAALPLATLLAGAPASLRPPAAASINVAVGGNGVWQINNGKSWTLSLTRASVATPHLRANAALFAAGKQTSLLQLRGRGQLAAMAITAARQYLPAGETRDWFEYAVLGGKIVDGKFSFALPSVSAALAGKASGASAQRFFVTAAFEGGTLRIDDGWPLAQNLAGAFVAQNDNIAIYGEGNYGGLAAQKAVATIPAATAKRATLYLDISGAPAGLRAHHTAALQTPPLASPLREALAGIALQGGAAQLSLTIVVPLASPQQARASADLRVKNAIAAGDAWTLRAVAGGVAANNDGAAGELRGVLGTNAAGSRVTVVFSNTALTARGHADAADLLAAAGAGLSVSTSGTTPFELRQTRAGREIFADLRAVAVGLPPPAGRAANDGRAGLRAQETAAQTLVVYNNGDDELRALFVGDGVDIAINAPSRPPPKSGARAHGAGTTNPENWLAFVAGGGDGAFVATLTLQNSRLLGAHHNFLTIAVAAASGGGRSLRIASKKIDGSAVWRGDRISANFATLWLATNDEEEAARQNDENDTGDEDGLLQNLSLRATVGRLLWGEDGITLGRAFLRGGPRDESWELARLNIKNGEAEFNAGGEYDGEITHITADLRAPDAARLMSVFNLPPVIGEGEVSLFGSFAWPNAPDRFSQKAMRGRLRVNIKNLRYLDIGAATGFVNLLAVFSPQSLLSFGFTDLAKPGEVIEETRGEVELKNGIASSSGIILRGDDLQMNIHGETDFINKKHRLRGRVRPGKKLVKAAGVVGIGAGGFVLEPLALLVGPVFNAVFDAPLSELGAYDYAITGDWESPVYAKIEATVNAADPQK